MKFKVRWEEEIEFETEIEANSEAEVKVRVYEHDYKCEAGSDIIDTEFKEDTLEIKPL